MSSAQAKIASSKVVLIGNIPFEQTEDDLVEIFTSVGPIQALRLIYERDPQTGIPTTRSKGYGFCQFEDGQTAQSAVRNLNGYDVAGRFLRVEQVPEEQMPSAAQSGSSYVPPSIVLVLISFRFI